MKFGIREVTDIVFKAKSNISIGTKSFTKGEPVLYFDSAKTSSMEGSSTQVFAQGGKGNPKRITWSGEKGLTFTFEDALITPTSAAILMGAEITANSASVPVREHVYGYVTCAEAGKLDLTGLLSDAEFAAPDATDMTGATIDADNLYVYEVDDDDEVDGANITGTVAAQVFTATTAGNVVANSRYLVDCYAAILTTVGKAQSILITPDKFSDYFYVEANTFWRRESDGKDIPAQITIPKASVQSNFTLTMANSGDPSTFTFTMDAMPDYTLFDKTKKVLSAIDILA